MSDKPAHTGQVSLEDFLDALEQRDQKREESRPLSTVETAAVGFGRWKNIVGAIVFFVALTGGGAVTFAELQAKPTTDQVDTQVEAAVAPVRAETDANRATVESVSDTMGDIAATQARQGEVQGYLLESMAWQGDVIQDIAQRKRPSQMTKKPDSLKAKEQKLLGASK